MKPVSFFTIHKAPTGRPKRSAVALEVHDRASLWEGLASGNLEIPSWMSALLN
jgi:hypothetical protein